EAAGLEIGNAIGTAIVGYDDRASDDLLLTRDVANRKRAHGHANDRLIALVDHATGDRSETPQRDFDRADPLALGDRHEFQAGQSERAIRRGPSVSGHRVAKPTR